MNDPFDSPLNAEVEAAGGVVGSTPAGLRPRHFGDPSGELLAAETDAVVFDRSHRARFRVHGRAPGQMLSGVVTGSVPTPFPEPERGRGRASYSAVLTPKGRLVTDLRMFARPGNEEMFLLEIPRAGAVGLGSHLARFIPPRLARVEDISGESGMITVAGPRAADRLSDCFGSELGGGTGTLESLDELDWVQAAGLILCRTGEVGRPAFDVVGEAEDIGATWDRLLALGVRPAGQALWDTFRVEAGRPAFGEDMDHETLPPEAGIETRAIDHSKGCYTGQEVIVRIRDRGHVNRHLRGLLFGDVPTPPTGTALFRVEDSREVGRVTSAVASAAFGQAIGLGYVRREVEPPATVLLGGPEGPRVDVRLLEGGSWTPPS